jgi:general stress protein 13
MKGIKVGDIVYGTVSGIQKYGIFVDLDHGYQGLVHISEAKKGYVNNLRHIVRLGQRVRVMVIDINEYNQKISLSLRILEQHNRHRKVSIRNKKHFFTDYRSNLGFSSIKKELPKWIEEGKKQFRNKY